MEETGYFFYVLLKSVRVGIAQIVRQNELVEAFVCGALGDIVEANLVGLGALAVALDKVGGYVCGGSAKLRGESELLVLWKSFRALIQSEREGVGFLPHHQLAKVL